MSNTAIDIQNVSKAYRLGTHSARPRTLVEAGMRMLSAPIRNFKHLYKLTHFEKQDDDDVLWAVRDLSLTIEKGDVVGIIGRNGAGKSTLLKILSRITEPTDGRVHIHGNLSSLLEVGTGFHPELSGRENIYLNGSILGMPKSEIQKKFDEIVAFSGVEKFLDTPVKRYSSGMYVRLAFAVAAHLEPDILLVDEVLAVGDISFQKKCLGKMNEVSKQEGRTVMFVSHNMGSIADLCNKVIYMQNGKMVQFGETNEVIAQYLKDVAGKKNVTFDSEEKHKKLRFTQATIIDHEGHENNELDLRFPFKIKAGYETSQALDNVELSFRVYQASGAPVFTSVQSDKTPEMVTATRDGKYSISIEIPGNFLVPGDYLISFFAHVPFGPFFDSQTHCLNFTIHDTGSGITRYKDYANMGSVLLPLHWEHEKA